MLKYCLHILTLNIHCFLMFLIALIEIDKPRHQLSILCSDCKYNMLYEKEQSKT